MVAGRSRLSLGCTFLWVAGWIIGPAVFQARVDFFGRAFLLAIALMGAGVLWNLDNIRQAWREDRSEH